MRDFPAKFAHRSLPKDFCIVSVKPPAKHNSVSRIRLGQRIIYEVVKLPAFASRAGPSAKVEAGAGGVENLAKNLAFLA